MGESTVWKILKCHFINQWCILIWSTDLIVSQKASVLLDRVSRNVIRIIKCSKKKSYKKKPNKQESDGLEGFDTRSIPIFVHYWQTVQSRLDRDWCSFPFCFQLLKLH